MKSSLKPWRSQFAFHFYLEIAVIHLWERFFEPVIALCFNSLQDFKNVSSRVLFTFQKVVLG